MSDGFGHVTLFKMSQHFLLAASENTAENFDELKKK
jgi:hypothetical protein